MSLTIRKVCDAEYKAARHPVRPPAPQKSALRPLRAPGVVKAQGGTRNKLVWLQIRLELEAMAVRS